MLRIRPLLDGCQDAAATCLIGVDPASLLRVPDEVESPVLKIVLERAEAGSRPGARADHRTVCLAIEGGGMRGAVSGGMCVLLEAARLVGAFDRIYGVSAGAMNGGATAMGQAALGATHYQDAASFGVDQADATAARALLDRPRPVVRGVDRRA